MSTAPHTLDPLHFPLHGARLIEASAGTGKTWTIAALYLRLVLGHGGPGAAFPGGGLQPGQILVMTFTRAATRELSDRIRARLLEAAQCFRAHTAEAAEADEADEAPGAAPPPPAPDPYLAALLAAFPDPAARRQAAWRLAVAAEAMDDAAIHTIDAWCQRMLREHAFDSGSLFDEELLADEAALLTQAVQDYWRQQAYPLAPEALDQLLGVWKSLDALQQDVRKLIAQPLPADAGAGSLAGLLQAHEDAQAPLVQGAAAQVAAMRQWLQAQLAAQPKHWSGAKLKPTSVGDWFDELDAWAAAPLGAVLPGAKSTLRTRLTPAGLADARNKAAPPLTGVPACFAWFENTVAALLALAPVAPRLRLHAAASVAQRLALLKRQSGHFGFADLQARLEAALAGPSGPRLRERLLRQTPVALIDEFQDTSALQFRLFDRLFDVQGHAPAPGQGDTPPATALLLIGDPKQSIYRFRGADIHSYLATRLATTGRHYVLGTNHRSTQALVAAVNHCFGRAESLCASAAFDHRQPPPDGAGQEALNPLPFIPVGAKGRAERFVSGGVDVPALQLAYATETGSAEHWLPHFGGHAAAQIVAWLNDPTTGFDHAGQFTRLRPADLAVLVRSRREAQAVRRALRQRGVASVYLSDRDSVFGSDEAADLLHWLHAVAQPQDSRLARAALATATVGLSLTELAQLAADDQAFETRSEQLRALHRVWQSQGVLPLLRQSLHLLQLPARWLAQPGGERRLTNYLHLAELLQAAARELEGEQALIRWLGEQIEAGATGSEGSDEQIVRLESDADLVKVVTVHKSKGLEYPVVLLPFATHFRAETKGRNAFVTRPDAAGRPVLNVSPDADDFDWLERERLREDLRLCYVALTRARHALWLGVAPITSGRSPDCKTHLSAFGRLLLGGAAQSSPESIRTALHALAESCPGGHIDTQPANASALRETLAPRQAPPPLQDAPAYTAQFDRAWGVSSFSALVRALPGASPLPSGAALAPARGHRPADDETLPLADAPPTATDAPPAPDLLPLAPAAAPWHLFERGALAGNFLHEQLEWLAGEGFALPAPEAEATPPATPPTEAPLLAALRRRCERAGRGGPQADTVATWLRAVVHQPLPGLGVALAGLGRVLPELEFWLPTQQLPARRLDAICRAHLLPGQDRPELPARSVHGLVMGFADLVFEHAGRYWVLDYKSNQLGPDAAAYTAPALAQAMAQHRYDVQAALYLLALHRLLAQRLGAAYQPEQHLGGAIYLFLSGIDGPAGGTCTLAATPALMHALDDLLGGTPSAADPADPDATAPTPETPPW